MHFGRTARSFSRITAALFTVSVLSMASRVLAADSGQAPTPVDLSKPLSADDCVRLALKRSYTVLQAQDRLAQARGARLSAWGGTVPSLTLSGDHSSVRNAGDVTNFHLLDPVQDAQIPNDQRSFGTSTTRNSNSYGFTASQTLSISNLINMTAAKRSVNAAAEEIAAAENEVAFAVRQQYFRLIEAQRLLGVSQDDVRLAEEELKRTEALFEVGSVARTDVLKAKVRVASAQSTLTASENDAQLQEARLLAALAIPVGGASIQIDDNLDPRSAAVDSAAAYAEAVAGRPDIRALQLRVSAASASVQSAQAARLPFLSHSYSKTYLPRRSTEFPDNNGKIQATGDLKTNSGTYNIGVTWSVFNGLVHEGSINSNKAARLSAQHSLEEKQIAVGIEVKEALLALRNAHSQVESATQAVTSADEDLKLSQERYNVGLGTILELIDARVGLTRARSGLVQAQAAVKIAEAQLDRATGRRNW